MRPYEEIRAVVVARLPRQIKAALDLGCPEAEAVVHQETWRETQEEFVCSLIAEFAPAIIAEVEKAIIEKCIAMALAAEGQQLSSAPTAAGDQPAGGSDAHAP